MNRPSLSNQADLTPVVTCRAAARRADDDRFCSMCDIDLGLHGTDEPSEDGFDCHIAEQKASLLRSMDRMFGVR